MDINFIESASFYVMAIISFFAFIGVIYFAYWFSKKLEKQNLKLLYLGFLMTKLFGIGLFVFMLFVASQWTFFSKSEAKKTLAEHKINLNDNFKIILTKRHGDGGSSWVRHFELEISENDKKAIIQQIKQAKDYQDTTRSIFNSSENAPRDTNATFTTNYSRKFNYTYQKLTTQKGYQALWEKISVASNTNRLFYSNEMD